MQIHEELITPDRAMELLSRNANNRKLRPGWVNELCRRILGGEWRLTHQGIAVDDSENLLDGQHRLLAIVKSKTAVPMFVATQFRADTPMDAPFDDGVRRSVADRFKIHRGVCETATFLGRLVFNHFPSSGQIQKVFDVFLPTIENLIERCGTSKRGRSSAAVRSAVTVRALLQDRELTLDLYRSFVLMDIDALPHSLISLMRQVDDGLNGQRHYELFGRAWVAFDQNCFSQQRIMVRDLAKIVGDARNQVKELMGLE